MQEKLIFQPNLTYGSFNWSSDLLLKHKESCLFHCLVQEGAVLVGGQDVIWLYTSDFIRI